MLNRVRVRDFQSIADLDLELGRFTVIGGATDNGKSAFIRAVRCLVANQAGQDFISRWANRCIVELELHDGTTVTWAKDSTGRYSLDGPEGQHAGEWSRLGRTIPQEVKDVLKLSPITFGDSDTEVWVNFFDQFDMPFMTAMPAPQRAKVLGELTGANILLSAAQAGQKKQRRTKSLLEIRRGDLEKAEANCARYEWLPTAEEQMRRAGDILSQASVIHTFVSDATRLRAAILTARDGLHAAEAAVKQLSRLPALIAAMPRIESLAERIQRGQKLAEQIRTARQDRNRASLVKSLKPISMSNIEKMSKLSVDLHYASLDVIAAMNESVKALEAVTSAEDDLRIFWSRYTQCPVCGSVVNASSGSERPTPV